MEETTETTTKTEIQQQQQEAQAQQQNRIYLVTDGSISRSEEIPQIDYNILPERD